MRLLREGRHGLGDEIIAATFSRVGLSWCDRMEFCGHPNDFRLGAAFRLCGFVLKRGAPCNDIWRAGYK